MEKITRRGFLQGLAAIGLIRLPEIDVGLPMAEQESEGPEFFWDGEDNENEFPYSPPSTTRGGVYGKNIIVNVNGNGQTQVLDFSLSFTNDFSLECSTDPYIWNPIIANVPRWDAEIWTVFDLGVGVGHSAHLILTLEENVTYILDGHLESLAFPVECDGYTLRRYYFEGFAPVMVDKML